MAVYTQVGQSDLESYLENYDLGDLVSYDGIESGVENSNYRLQTTKGVYILTLYEKRVKESDLPFFISLMDHLSTRNFVCPRPQPMRDGTVLGKLCGRPSSIVSFLEGSSVVDVTPEQCHRAGATLAQLHLSSSDFTGKRQNALNVAGWQPLLESTSSRADEVESGLSNLITEQYESLSHSWPTDLPTGIIHADFFKDNIFFKGDEIYGVIDFYFACTDILSYDLAIAINAWCYDSNDIYLPAHSRAFISGYESARKLSDSEKSNFPILLRGASLRFLLTRLYDWLNVPDDALVTPHDPKAFSARLRHFITHDIKDHFA